MAKLKVENSKEIARATTESYLLVLRERNYKTKPREVELLVRSRGEYASGYHVAGKLKAALYEGKTPAEMQAWLDDHAAKREARYQARRLENA